MADKKQVTGTIQYTKVYGFAWSATTKSATATPYRIKRGHSGTNRYFISKMSRFRSRPGPIVLKYTWDVCESRWLPVLFVYIYVCIQFAVINHLYAVTNYKRNWSSRYNQMNQDERGQASWTMDLNNECSWRDWLTFVARFSNDKQYGFKTLVFEIKSIPVEWSNSKISSRLIKLNAVLTEFKATRNYGAHIRKSLIVKRYQ